MMTMLPCHAVAGEPVLDLGEEIIVNDGLVLARPCLALVNDVAGIDPVLQHRI